MRRSNKSLHVSRQPSNPVLSGSCNIFTFLQKNEQCTELVLPEIQDPTKTLARNYRAHQQIKKINEFFSIDIHLRQNKISGDTGI